MFQAPSRRNRLVFWALTAGLLTVGGCASPPTRDGPPQRVPAGLERTPDATPRLERIRAGGPNQPYEVGGRRIVPMTQDLPLRERGLASWYGTKYHGRPTSSGEIYDMFAMTAAHRTMPIPSYAVVRNPANGRQVVVRINDRGPFVFERVIDLSYVAALKLGVLSQVSTVVVERITQEDIRKGWRAQSGLEWTSDSWEAQGALLSWLEPMSAQDRAPLSASLTALR